MNAEIVFRTINPFPGKLEIFTAGGFNAVTPEGLDFVFDWMSSYANSKHDEQGRLVIHYSPREFDEEYFSESRGERQLNLKEITPQMIVKSKLLEAFYEAYADQKEEIFVPLELVSFTLFGWEGSIFTEEIFFSTEEIARYNREEGHKFNFPDKEDSKCE